MLESERCRCMPHVLQRPATGAVAMSTFTQSCIVSHAYLADLASVQLCVLNKGGQIQVGLGFVQEDGRVWWSEPPSSGTSRRPFNSSNHVTARARVWFERREPLQIDGKTFVYVEPHQATWAFNRYYRDHAPVDGVAAAVPMGRAADTLLILTDPIGCWFAEYRLDQPD